MPAEWMEIINLVFKVLGVIGGILSPIIAAVIWIFRNSFEIKFVTKQELEAAKEEGKEEFRKVHDRLNDGDRRFENLATKEQLNGLMIELKEASGDLKAATAEMHGMQREFAGLNENVRLLLEKGLKE